MGAHFLFGRFSGGILCPSEVKPCFLRTIFTTKRDNTLQILDILIVFSAHNAYSSSKSPCAQTKQGKARVSSAKTKRGRVGEIARARGYLRPPTAGYFYIDILARAAARGRRPEGCGAGSYRQYRPIGRSPKPKFGRGDGRLGDRPAIASSGWRETAAPMRGHRHHSRIGRANALTGRHARPACPSSGPPASQPAAGGQLRQDLTVARACAQHQCPTLHVERATILGSMLLLSCGSGGSFVPS